MVFPYLLGMFIAFALTYNSTGDIKAGLASAAGAAIFATILMLIPWSRLYNKIWNGN